MSFVKCTLRDENWTRQGIKCDGCPIIWLQDFPDQPLSDSGFYEDAQVVRSDGDFKEQRLHACSEKHKHNVELCFMYLDWQQDKYNIRWKIFRWKKIEPATLVYQGEGI